MTNQYFNHDNPLDRHTLGRAELVNAIFEAVVAGFDKLPNPDLINQAAQTYADDTGAANAYVVSLPKAPQAYTAGLTITMRAANANTGASTINVDGLGAKTIKRYSGDPLIAGDILVGQLVVLGYDGTDFRLVGVHGGEVELARQWATSLTIVGSGMKGSRGYAKDAAASAGAAKDSEDAALLSEQNTEALYVDFRKRYYGQYASDPATDPLGNAPQGGAFYYNTTAKEMRIYDEDDDSWSAIGMGTLQTFVFTAAGGETSLSGLDDNNRALNYSPGFELVYLNGARLVPGDDYVASNGSTITGLTALSPGDVVVMDAFTRFSLTEERLSLINNIAALRLKSGAAGFDRAWLKCHTTDGDGGHGPFRWLFGAAPGTYVDNNGTIIVPTGGNGSAAWVRDIGDYVTPEMFGAVGDAVTDDTAAIQATFNFACPERNFTAYGVNEIKSVEFRPGKYLVTNLLLMHRLSTNGDERKWRINLNGAEIIQSGGATGPTLEISSCKRLAIHNGKINGTTAITGMWDSHFSNLQLGTVTVGVRTATGTNLFASNYWNHFERCRMGPLQFTISVGASNQEFNANTFISCIASAITITGNANGSFQGNVWFGGELRGNPFISVDAARAGSSTPNSLTIVSAYFDMSGVQTDLYNFQIHMLGVNPAPNGYVLDGQFLTASSRLSTNLGGIREGARIPVSASNLVVNGDLSNAAIGETLIDGLSTYNVTAEIKAMSGAGVGPFAKYAELTNTGTFPWASFRTVKVPYDGVYTITVIYRKRSSGGNFAVRFTKSSNGSGYSIFGDAYDTFANAQTLRDGFVVASYTAGAAAGEHLHCHFYGGNNAAGLLKIDVAYVGCTFGSQGLLLAANAPQLLTPKNIGWRSAAPTTGTWQQGDIIYNTAPAAGGTIGWVCTAAGTPGTWKTFGNIEP